MEKFDCVSYMSGECDLSDLVKLYFAGFQPCPEKCPYYVSELD